MPSQQINIEKTKVTTIKISLDTKTRIDKLKEYQRETYDEVLRKILNILNTAKSAPSKSFRVLRRIDKAHSKRFQEIY